MMRTIQMTYTPRNKLKLLVLICIFLCTTIFFTGCSPIISNTQLALSEWIILHNSGNMGQTFVANYDGLSGIQLWISPKVNGDGKINIHLRTDPKSSVNIASTSLSLSKVNAEGMYSFFFTPQNASRRNYYYLAINISGEGSVQLGAAGGENYLDGARYENTISQDGQLAFRLIYSVRRLGIGLIREIVIWASYLLVGIFLLIVPGFGLLSILLPQWERLNTLEKIGVSSGVSLAIYPMIILWTSLIGLRMGSLYALIPAITGFILILVKKRNSLIQIKNFRYFLHTIPSKLYKPFQNIRWTESMPNVALVLVIVFIVVTRFWAIRDIDAPMWGDSYQHTIIAQRIVENKGLFTSWQPYAELQTLTYHFGFHTIAAVAQWITGMSMPRIILWVGQIINILAVLSLYPVVKIISRNRWGGIIALIIAGLLTPVPMVYTNWGRYTQLAGQVIFSTAIYLFWVMFILPPNDNRPTLVESKWHDRKHVVLAGIVIGGLSLTHFRVLIFSLLFLASIFIYYAISKRPVSQWKTLLKNTFWIGVVGGGIFLPWFINVYGGKIMRNFTNQLNTPASSVPIETQSYNSIGNLLQYMPVGIWLILPVALAWIFWKRHTGIALISLWSFVLFLAANPSWLQLPGTGAISNFAIFIAIYIPASIILGGTVGIFISNISSGGPQTARIPINHGDWKARLLRLGVVDVRNSPGLTGWGSMIISVILIGVSLSGSFTRLKDLTPEKSSLLTRPDLRAASWIKDNLHPNAHLLVNSMFAYGGSLVVGSDGGWWLPVLTGRRTTLPPLNYGTEQAIRSDYKKWVNELPKTISEKGITHPDVLQMLDERKITQVYIGQKQGMVNNFGDALIDPEALRRDEHFKEIYHQDRVWIFDVIQAP